MRVVSVGMCGVYVSMGVGVRWVWRAWCVCMKRVEFMHVAVFQIPVLQCIQQTAAELSSWAAT